jgi:RNA polymerase sigma-70 factor (ECF subfamily)
MAEPVPIVGQWLPAARAGSSTALGQALEACRAYLLTVANRQLDAELQAKGGPSDLVQETFLEAQRDFARFHGDSGAELLAWLRQLLLHNLANFKRRYRGTGKRQVGREVVLQSDTPSGDLGGGVAADTPTPSKQAAAEEQAQAVERALQRLPDNYRQVILWRYREGRSFAEIAQLMGSSENAVRKLWFRGIERLQREMDEPS